MAETAPFTTLPEPGAYVAPRRRMGAAHRLELGTGRAHATGRTLGLGFRCAGGPSAPMTTENVAVLFTDMVGSTALSSALSPDAADELRREHFSILRRAVTELGGTEVKNLGDGLMVVFASTSAALSCAV